MLIKSKTCASITMTNSAFRSKFVTNINLSLFNHSTFCSCPKGFVAFLNTKYTTANMPIYLTTTSTIESWVRLFLEMFKPKCKICKKQTNDMKK